MTAGPSHTRGERADPGAGRRPLHAVLVFLLALLCVPVFNPSGLDLVDGSWVLANSWAHVLGLQWGTDLAYTYGPLGFLRTPVPFSAGLVVGGLLFWVASSMAIISGTVALLGPRVMAWIVGAVSASLATTVPEISAPIVGVMLVAVAIRLRPPPAAPAVAFGLLGAVAALLLLTKFNAGVTASAVVGTLAVVGPRRARAAVGALAGFGVGLLVLWLMAGGELRGLFRFLVDSAALAAGYSHALSNGSRTSGALAVYVAGGILFATLVVAAWMSSRGAARDVRVGVVVAAVLLGTSAWLQGFGRFDPGHLAIYFSIMGAACLPLVGRALAGRPALQGVGLVGCIAVASGPLLVALASPGGGAPLRIGSPTLLVHPHGSLTQVREAVHLIVSEDARTQRLDSLRAQFVAEAAVSDSIAAALGGSSAHAEPQAVGIVWALGGSWAPVPVYQTHMAYSRYLDSRNAQSIVDSPSTQLVLREDYGLDGTNPLWQSPQLQQEYVCRFRVEDHDPRWTLLRRSDDRCGAPRRILEQDLSPGQTVGVPISEGVVVAEVAAAEQASGRLEVTCDGRAFPLMQRTPTALVVSLPSASGWAQQTSPLSCASIAFSAAVHVTWSEVPLSQP